MLFCSNCGKQIKEDAKFCVFCGQAHESPPTEPQPSSEWQPPAPEWQQPEPPLSSVQSTPEWQPPPAQQPVTPPASAQPQAEWQPPTPQPPKQPAPEWQPPVPPASQDGNPLPTPAVQPAQQEVPAKKINKTAIIASIITGVVVVALAGVLFFTNVFGLIGKDSGNGTTEDDDRRGAARSEESSSSLQSTTPSNSASENPLADVPAATPTQSPPSILPPLEPVVEEPEDEEPEDEEPEDEEPEVEALEPTGVITYPPHEECAEIRFSKTFIEAMEDIDGGSIFADIFNEQYECEELEQTIVYWVPWIDYNLLTVMFESTLLIFINELTSDNGLDSTISDISWDNENGELIFYFTHNVFEDDYIVFESLSEEDIESLFSIYYVSIYAPFCRAWSSFGLYDTVAVSVVDAVTSEVYVTFESPYDLVDFYMVG